MLAELSTVPSESLHEALGFDTPFVAPPASRGKRLAEWKMTEDDAPILRYLFRHARPRRHLEFGTWEGHGTVCCLEECGATVWTINLPEGEKAAGGKRAYRTICPVKDALPWWVKRMFLGRVSAACPSDTVGNIGRMYREKGFGPRVCQIYSDSREWDTSNYPAGFFDTVLIDGGHTEEIVRSDTRKAVPLVRSGGLIVWHDFCPREDVMGECGSTRGVYEAIAAERDYLKSRTSKLFWIEPSWLLVAVKA